MIGLANLSPLVALAGALIGGVIDARTGLIPDRLTYPTIGILAVLSIALKNVPSLAQGMLSVGGSLLLLHLLTRGKGMGLGDVKLATCIGGGLGMSSGFVALALACILGGVVAAFRLYVKKDAPTTRMAFGPFLASGTFLVFTFGLVMVSQQ